MNINVQFIDVKIGKLSITARLGAAAAARHRAT